MKTKIPKGKTLYAVKYRIYPDDSQANFFMRTFGCCRKYWNLALEDRNKQYEIKRSLPEDEKEAFEIKTKTPAYFKNDYPYMKEVDSLALANVQIALNKAFSDFFKGNKNIPRKKKKSLKFSYTTNNQDGSVEIIDNKYLSVPKLKTNVRIKIHRVIDGIIRSVTISKEPSGKWYASILFLINHDTRQPSKTKKAVGIDFGLKQFITDSYGNTADSVRFFRDAEKKLAREKRKLSRRCLAAKARGVKLYESKNYQKQRIKVAKMEEKIRNQRKDFLHKLSRKYVNEYDIIGIEDLNIKGMTKNHHLSKAVQDAGWYSFTVMLQYKAAREGKEIIKVSRWFPSTQTCSECGSVLSKENKLTLKDRDWTCPQCGAHHDRDINAAINIKNEAICLCTA